MKTEKSSRKITGHVMYMGPHFGKAGLYYNKTFLPNNDFKEFEPWIEKCPALAELFVPVEKIAEARRALNFDYARNMCGGDGPYPTFYREIKKWIARQVRETKTAHTGITLEKHHA